jgi:hypothetical protein
MDIMNNQFNSYPNGGNPFNQFTSSSAYMLQNMTNSRGMSNFDGGFIQPAQIIERTNFTNPGTVTHNNLHDNLLSEHVTEYFINIDSDDRKIETYPDPFNYVVTFKSLGKSTYKPFKKKNGDFNGFENIELPETPAPVIMRQFKNVKFVKLDHIVLSRYNSNRYTMEQHIAVDTKNSRVSIESALLSKHCHKLNASAGCYMCRTRGNCNGSLCGCNCKECLVYARCTKCFVGVGAQYTGVCSCKSDDGCHTCRNTICRCSMNDMNKFLILKIRELKNNRIYSTNTATSDNTFILHLDKCIGAENNIWISRCSTCTFPSSLLLNLDRLSIEFCNNRGEKLSIGIILECNIRVNDAYHHISLIFGKVDECIRGTLSGIKLDLPIGELPNTKSWYSTVFNVLLSHISDTEMKTTLSSNHEKICASITELDFNSLIRYNATNNVFLIIGAVQNELNTLTKYES